MCDHNIVYVVYYIDGANRLPCGARCDYSIRFLPSQTYFTRPKPSSSDQSFCSGRRGFNALVSEKNYNDLIIINLIITMITTASGAVAFRRTSAVIQ